MFSLYEKKKRGHYREGTRSNLMVKDLSSIREIRSLNLIITNVLKKKRKKRGC